MDFERQYRIFLVSFLFGFSFFVITNSLSSTNSIFDFLLLMLQNLLIYGVVLGISLLFLGGLSSYDIHLIYSHLVTLIVFGFYGLFLTLDNLAYIMVGQCLLCPIPFHIPYTILLLRTRHFVIISVILAALVLDMKELGFFDELISRIPKKTKA